MFKAVKLASVGLCALTALLSPVAASATSGPDLTTWIFAEGSTNASFGFEQEILIGNPNTSVVTLTFNLFTQDGEQLAPVVRTVAPLSRTGFSVRSLVGDRAGVALKLTSSLPIVAERTMYWGGGLYRGDKVWTQKVNDMRGGHAEHGATSGAKKWYFAEGEARYFNSFISVANPNAVATKVRATYRDDAGRKYTDTEIVPAFGRRTFWPTAAIGDKLKDGQAGFATVVESLADNSTTDDAFTGEAQDIVAERQMYWGAGIRGGTVAMGITEPEDTWLFAEGIQGSLAPGAPVYETFVLLFNPNASPIDIKVEFFGQGGAKLAEVTRTVAADARDNVWAREVEYPVGSGLYPLRNAAFSIRTTSAAEFIAERAVYWGSFAEGSATGGASAPALKWGFAEGQQGGFLMYQDDNDTDKRRFNTFFPIYNPGTTPATVTVHFYTENGDTGNQGVTKTITVPGQSRETVWTLLYDELANGKFATFFSSDQPIVVERAMYWGRGNKAGHAALGTPFPEGFTFSPAPNARTIPTATLTVTPNRGTPTGGTEVKIEGAGFGNTEFGTQVLFGGVAAREFEVENDSLIKAKTPGGKGPVDVTVITRGQTVTLPGGFTFFDPNAAGPAVSYNILGTVSEVAAARPFDLANSCKETGGNNTFMFEVVAALRLKYNTNRFGLNWKRGNVGDMSQDIVNYYTGAEGTSMRNSTSVRIYDIVGGHCGTRPVPNGEDVTQKTIDGGTVGKWTTDPMCTNSRYRDAKYPNGDWLFPECRP
ncbi:hypothetical protein TBR22_A21640 [Luteitalea sp. TBR-22]|uniref:IPT/TIG domain-containing protein n=1 Tax=Luteitalea sp. TBR-22 TaxID=2802971 RepID=UPI001AFC4F78|nr:IPT/TIG domain-containing protein [Luteitalea sp. TBR-22]BCS32940.1 hypothetical protein TBR22_A21640 [Luteitalea sp. TBR-22]